MSDEASADLREQVRSRYAEAARAVLEPRPGVTARCCESSPADSCCGTGSAALDSADCFGGPLYGEGETDGLPEEAVLASLGCGNPLAVADLHEGERVLDLGSGGGIDVLLSARRVGPSGFAYGVDMTDDMLTLARANAAKAGAANVEFLKGEIEALPLPDAVGGRGDLQLRDQPVHRQARRARARCSASWSPAGGSASPTWWPRTTCRLLTGPRLAPMLAASPVPCPGPSTLTGSPPPASPARRSPSPPRRPRDALGDHPRRQTRHHMNAAVGRRPPAPMNPPG